MTSNEIIPPWIKNFGPFKEAQQKAAADEKSERDRHAAALRAGEQELAKVLPPLLQDEREWQAKVEAAELVVLKVRSAWDKAIGTRLNAVNQIETRLNAHRAALTETAPKIIAEFAAELEAEKGRMRHRNCDAVEGNITERLMSISVRTTNSDAFRARIRQLSEILSTEIPRLRLLPEDELPAAIQSLRQSIPVADGKWNDPKFVARILNPPAALRLPREAAYIV